jgi:hypothetical protein
MKLKSLIYLPFIGLIFIFNSCNKSSRFEIDTTKERIEVKIHRFDKDFISLDTANMKSGLNQLFKKYSEFLPVFTNEILDTTATDTAAIQHLFYKFLTDTTFAQTNKKTLETFANITDIEQQISDAYTYIHHYFPEVKLPEIYFYVSGFNRSVMMNNKFIGIGTDFYLGSDFYAYKGLTYEYLVKNMRRECLATDLVSATLFRMFLMNSSQNRLLDNMLFRGKVLYLMSVFMPNEKPENIIGYSPEQLKWCLTNEKQIWGAIIDQKHLFSTDMLLIKKYMNDAPFTATISQESPGRLGTWIGLQIVQSYMNKNHNVSLRDLMKESDYQKMLENSGYRP